VGALRICSAVKVIPVMAILLGGSAVLFTLERRARDTLMRIKRAALTVAAFPGMIARCFAQGF
jgi:hypothetical protein